MNKKAMWSEEEDKLAEQLLTIASTKDAIEFIQEKFPSRSLMSVFQRIYIKHKHHHEAHKLLQKRMYSEKHSIDGEMWLPTGAVCKMLANNDARNVEDFELAGVKSMDDPELPGIVKIWNVADFTRKILNTPPKLVETKAKTESSSSVTVSKIKDVLIRVKMGKANISEVYTLLGID